MVDTVARHVSRGKVAFFEKAGLDLVAGEREGPFHDDVFSDRRFIDCHCSGGLLTASQITASRVAALGPASGGATSVCIAE